MKTAFLPFADVVVSDDEWHSAHKLYMNGWGYYEYVDVDVDDRLIAVSVHKLLMEADKMIRKLAHLILGS